MSHLTTDLNVANNLAAWYERNVRHMTVPTLTRNRSDLENLLILADGDDAKLTEKSRLEIAKALQVINSRLDELIPHKPAAIETHDRSSGDRIRQAWPDHLSHSSMQVHMHLCELLHAWVLNSPKNRASVDEYAQMDGTTRFIFDSPVKLHEFLEAYSLLDFLIERGPAGTVNSETREPFYYAIFSNQFAKRDVDEFLDIYKSAINQLAIIYDERRRAVNVDAGIFGFITADHFHARECVELEKLQVARIKLGAGFREANKKAARK